MSSAEQETPADAWGQPISEERQAELRGYLDRWAAEADHGTRKGPFDHEKLTGAEVAWLADASARDGRGNVSNLHLEGAVLGSAYLKRADLEGAHLEGAHLEGAHLEEASLGFAHLEKAKLSFAHLECTDFISAHLEDARFGYAYMEETNFCEAHLERADFEDAHLEGAYLLDAYLEDAYLCGASFDKATLLKGARLTGVQLDGASFGNAYLGEVDWRIVPMLGDEILARQAKWSDRQTEWIVGRPKDRPTRVKQYRAAVRANRRLAAALQTNGMNEDAARYNYRAQLCQRASLLYEGRFAQYLGSWILAGLAGYGYRPSRTILLYVGVLLSFAVLYLSFGMVDGHAFNAVEAAVFSVTSFHGRGFFPGGLMLDDPVTVLAAVEAVIGLLIEISFIATFTQRFFNAR